MYKPRLKGSHGEMGAHYGALLYKNGVQLYAIMPTTNKQIAFGKRCLSICKEHYPEIVDEIQAMAQEMHLNADAFGTFIITAGAFTSDIGCTVFTYKTAGEIYFCRNHDMFSNLKKVTESALVRPENGYYFVGQGDGLIGKEDGLNEYGLAVGMNFIAPKVIKPGLNFFLLIRMLLEKCRTVDQAIKRLKEIPVCTSHNIILADKEQNMAVVEMCPERTKVRFPESDSAFMISTNHFQHPEMLEYDNKPDSDWYSTKTRCDVVRENLISPAQISTKYFEEILSGKKGMMCQYDRKLHFETLWSVIYQLKGMRIRKTEGNPVRKKYLPDHRLEWAMNKRKS